MKEKELNLCEMLKGHEGETFYSPVYGNIILKDIDDDYLTFSIEDSIEIITIHSNGRYFSDSEIIIVYPSRDERDWDKWYRENKPYYTCNKEKYVDKKKRDKMVEAIMREFDFDKVHRVMKFLDWKYWFSNKVVSLDDICETALECLNKVKYSTEHSYCSTGGFCATFYDGVIKLSFEIEELDVEGEY